MNKAQEMKQKVQDLKNIRRHFLRQKDQCAALVVGHYCHDQIILQGGEIVYSLGGGGESGSFITNVFQALGMESREREFRVCVDISMVGSIFFTVGAVSNICCFPNSMH